MNHTQNYQLNQWGPEDKVQRTDFNADNAKIDAALKVEADARTALAQTVSSQGSTLSGHASSLGKKGSCQTYTTTYSGNGTQTRTFSFSGYPVLVHIREAGASSGFTFIRGLNCPTSQTYSASWSSRSLTLTNPAGNNFGFNYSGYNFFIFALLDMSK